MSCRQPSTSPRGLHLQALLHARVPRLAEILHGEVAGEQLLLEVVAQHHVQRIRELVRIHAHRAAAHAREQRVQVFHVPLGTGDGEVPLQQRPQVRHERAAAAHDHLDEQRLAFLQRHAAIAPHRLVRPLARNPQVVQRMTGLVHRGQQPGEDVARIQARGDADVARHAFGERMLALVEPPAVEGKPHRLHDFRDEALLLARREAAGHRQQLVLVLLLDDFADQRRQAPRERAEDRVDVGREHARAEFVHERVVRRQVQGLSQQRRLVAHESQHLFEMRRKYPEVVLLPRFDPAHLGDRGDARQARDERRGRGDGVIALPAHGAQVGHLPVLERRLRRLCPVEQARDLGCGEQRVLLDLDGGELLAAHIGAAARHHYRRVPTQQRQRAAKSVQTLPLLFELSVRRGGHGKPGKGPGF